MSVFQVKQRESERVLGLENERMMNRILNKKASVSMKKQLEDYQKHIKAKRML